MGSTEIPKSILHDSRIDCIIDLDNEELEQLLNMRKRSDKAMAAHSANCNYSIILPNSESKYPRWSVWVKKDGEKRKKLAKKTKDELIEAMYEYYFSDTIKTFNDLYPLWVESRSQLGLDPDTLRKDQNHYDKFYKDNPVMDKLISKLVPNDITEFLNHCIVEYQLTRKALNNMKLIIKQLCALAVHRGLTKEVLYIKESVRLDRCMVSRAKKETKTERALPDDIKKILVDYLYSFHESKPNSSTVLALIVSLNTGLRAGELSSILIKMVDLDDKILYVRNSENSSTKVVRDKLKSDSAYRAIPLNERAYNAVLKAIAIANESKEPSGYLFVDENGNRQSARSISAMLARCCDKLEIIRYSSHDLRRTVATNIYNNNNNDISIVQAILGHSTASQSYDYIQDVVDRKDIAAALDTLC